MHVLRADLELQPHQPRAKLAHPVAAREPGARQRWAALRLKRHERRQPPHAAATVIAAIVMPRHARQRSGGGGDDGDGAWRRDEVQPDKVETLLGERASLVESTQLDLAAHGYALRLDARDAAAAEAAERHGAARDERHGQQRVDDLRYGVECFDEYRREGLREPVGEGEVGRGNDDDKGVEQ